MKYKIYFLLMLISMLLISSILTGCATASRESLLRQGYGYLDTGNAKAADKEAQRVLKRYRGDHDALLLRAKASETAGRTTEAVDIVTRMDRGCASDICPNVPAHVDGLLFMSSLTNDEEVLRRSQEKIKALYERMKVSEQRQLVDFYVRNSRPLEAAAAFDKRMEITGGNISPEERMVGFVLYHATFQREKARVLFNEMTTAQKAKVRETYDDI